jgi:hypothetical protein
MLKTVSSITNAIGALNYKGTWNASTNTPALASGVGTKGDYYVVSVAGSTNLDGETLWGVGDWAVYNGAAWQKVEGGNTINATTVSASTSVTTPVIQATSSAGGTLKNNGGTAQLQWGSGGGSNLSLEVATNINPANAAVAISPTGTGTVTINPATASTMNNVAIGGSTPLAGSFTTATANSYNKMAITAPATSSTLAVADGKTLTASNSLTLAGTDATTMTFPATSATIARTDASQTFIGSQTLQSPNSAGAGLAVTNASASPIIITGAGSSTYAVAPNAANCALFAYREGGTGRSINAGGTINASGADYAEYMTKSGDFTLAKGAVVGIDANGKLTNVFADAVSFVVKSTDPSYVGGDTWGNEEAIGKKPDDDAKQEEKDAFETILESSRQLVDRIAFAGQVPVNVLGATAGQYIIPVNDNGAIKGEAVSSPTFEQYQTAVGKVIAIEADGRARIIVKVA